jgi:cytochrome c-type protein NapB
MKKSLKVSLLAILTLTVAACATTAVQLSTLREQSVSSADSAPNEKAYVGKRPGQQALIARTFEKQPPLVPHTVDGYNIFPGDNSCLDCHISDEFKGKKMPKMGASHFLKTTQAGAEPVVDMQRWQCDSCHVAQVDAKPLVDNDFQGLASKPN